MANDYSGANAHVVLPIVHSGDSELHHVAVDPGVDLSLHQSLLQSGYAPMPTASKQPTKEGSLEYSPEFRKAGAELWSRSNMGQRPGEVGTYLDSTGKVGPYTFHAQEPDGASVQVSVPKGAPYVAHTHPNYADSEPSPQDIAVPKAFKKTIFVVSSTGLHAIDPAGNVTTVFHNTDWPTSKHPQLPHQRP